MQAAHQTFFPRHKTCYRLRHEFDALSRQHILGHSLARIRDGHLRFGVTLLRELDRLMLPRIKHMLVRLRELLSDGEQP